MTGQALIGVLCFHCLAVIDKAEASTQLSWVPRLLPDVWGRRVVKRWHRARPDPVAAFKAAAADPTRRLDDDALRHHVLDFEVLRHYHHIRARANLQSPLAAQLQGNNPPGITRTLSSGTRTSTSAVLHKMHASPRECVAAGPTVYGMMTAIAMWLQC